MPQENLEGSKNSQSQEILVSTECFLQLAEGMQESQATCLEGGTVIFIVQNLIIEP